MIHLSQTLDITLPDTYSKTALRELQQDIITELQKQLVGATDPQSNENYLLLELLKATLSDHPPGQLQLRYLNQPATREIAETLGLLLGLSPQDHNKS